MGPIAALCALQAARRTQSAALLPHQLRQRRRRVRAIQWMSNCVTAFSPTRLATIWIVLLTALKINAFPTLQLHDAYLFYVMVALFFPTFTASAWKIDFSFVLRSVFLSIRFNYSDFQIFSDFQETIITIGNLATSASEALTLRALGLPGPIGPMGAVWSPSSASPLTCSNPCGSTVKKLRFKKTS